MTKIHTLEAEFPDYGPLDFEPPLNWIASHWHNNSCPSWESPKKPNGQNLTLWAEYADESKRESKGLRFTLCLYFDGEYVSTLCESDIYSDVLECIFKQNGEYDIEALAKQFIIELRETVSDEEMDEINARNATPEYINTGCCASHDFCDPNQCMIDALENLGFTFETQDNAQLQAIDQAWTLAKSCEFNADALANVDKR